MQMPTATRPTALQLAGELAARTSYSPLDLLEYARLCRQLGLDVDQGAHVLKGAGTPQEAVRRLQEAGIRPLVPAASSPPPEPPWWAR